MLLGIPLKLPSLYHQARRIPWHLQSDIIVQLVARCSISIQVLGLPLSWPQGFLQSLSHITRPGAPMLWLCRGSSQHLGRSSPLLPVRNPASFASKGPASSRCPEELALQHTIHDIRGLECPGGCSPGPSLSRPRPLGSSISILSSSSNSTGSSGSVAVVGSCWQA